MLVVVTALALVGVDGPFPSLNSGIGVPRAVATTGGTTVLIGTDGPVSLFEHTAEGLLLFSRRTSPAGGKAASDTAVHAVDGLVVGPDGVVYISTNGSVLHREPGGGWMRTLAASSGDTVPVRPSGLAMDQRGRLVIADPGGHRVFRLDRGTARLELIAGTGVPGFSGDGGPAIAAQLDAPESVAVAPDGTIYIADRGNQRVRRLGEDRAISTVAGGLSEPTGVAWIRPASLLVAESAGHRIRRVDLVRRTTHAFAGTGEGGFSGDGGGAAAARLRNPRALVALRNGDVIIADSGNRRIRKVSRGRITTIAGDGGVGYVGDGGPASAAVVEPSAIAIGRTGDVFVAEALHHRIRRIDPRGIISTVAGTGIPGYSGDGGPARDAQIWHPTDVAVASDGSLFVADSKNRCVRKISADGRITTIVTSADPRFGRPAHGVVVINATEPWSVALFDDRFLFVADPDAIWRVDLSTGTSAELWRRPPAAGDPKTHVGRLTSLAATSADEVLVAAMAPGRIYRLVVSRGQLEPIAGAIGLANAGTSGPAAEMMLGMPTGMAVATEGHIMIADWPLRRVWRLDVQRGEMATVLQQPGILPTDVAVMADGTNVIAADASVWRQTAGMPTATLMAGNGIGF